MLKYFIKLVLLRGCPYSINAYKIIKRNNIPYKKLVISDNEKYKFKTELINTFPQVYLCKYTSEGHLLLGGNDVMVYCLDNLKNKKLTPELIDSFYKKYKWSKCAIIAIYKLFNLK
jgi:glutaredoxin